MTWCQTSRESTTIVDGTTIEVTLRPGQTFSDGQPFDAAAVKRGLERMLTQADPAGPSKAFFSLETVEAVDALTVRLLIPDGTAASWHDSVLPSWETSIIPADFDPQNPVGAGPMRVTEFVPQQTVVFERRDDYWDSASIVVKTLELMNVGSDASAATTALAAGQVQFANIGSVTNIPAIGSGNEVVFTPSPDELMTLMVCKRDDPLADPRVRLALNKAIDRDAINEAVFEGAFVPAYGLWPDGHRFHDPSVNEAITYDPEGARALLAEAGYVDGFTFDIYMIMALGMPDVSLVIQQQFADVGVNANLIPAPNYVDEFLGAGKAGAGAVPTMAPNRGKLLQYTTTNLGNTCTYDDDELDELYEQLSTVSDSSDQAVELWNDLEQKIVAEDALSVFILFGSTIIGFDTSTVGNPIAMPGPIVLPDVRETYVRAE